METPNYPEELEQELMEDEVHSHECHYEKEFNRNRDIEQALNNY